MARRNLILLKRKSVMQHFRNLQVYYLPNTYFVHQIWFLKFQAAKFYCSVIYTVFLLIFK